jgi:hypothetical protein
LAGSGEDDKPQVIFLDASNGVHVSNVGSNTNELNAHVAALLDDGILIVGELWWCSVGIKLDVIGNQLDIVR